MTLEFKYLIPETPTLAFHFLYRDIFSNISVCCMSITNTPLERFKCSTQLFWIIWITSCGCFRNLKHLLLVFKSRLSKLLSSAVSPFLFLILHIPGPAVCMQVISAQLPTQHDKYVLHPLLVPTWMGLRSYVGKNKQSLTVNGSQTIVDEPISSPTVWTGSTNSIFSPPDRNIRSIRLIQALGGTSFPDSPFTRIILDYCVT